jgi:hypothetical protein
VPWETPFTVDEIRLSAGFVYLITNILTGRMYVGRKYTTSKIKGREIESNWQTYYGSCKALTADIAEFGREHFSRQIIQIYPTRSEVNYAETEEQFRRDVLRALMPNGGRAFYNANIMSKYFVPNTTTRGKKQKLTLAHFMALQAGR